MIYGAALLGEAICVSVGLWISLLMSVRTEEVTATSLQKLVKMHQVHAAGSPVSTPAYPRCVPFASSSFFILSGNLAAHKSHTP